MKRLLLTASTFALMTGMASAHVMVSPLESKTGVTQAYELRVHNEGKLMTTALDLEIPEGVTVVDIATPATGTFNTTKTGDRITAVTWTVDVEWSDKPGAREKASVTKIGAVKAAANETDHSHSADEPDHQHPR